MPISAVYGLPGRGKSHFMLFYALFIANKFQKKLVTNFPLEPYKLARYCSLMRYEWLLKHIDRNTVYYCNTGHSLAQILSIPNSVVLLDEAGVFLNSREYQKTPKSLIADFAQVRKFSNYFIFSAQTERQTDVALKEMAEEIFFCNGVSIFDKKLNNEKLIYKSCRRFTPDNFQVFNSNPKIKRNPIKCKLLSSKSWMGPLSISDLYLFSVYPSFARLESDIKISDTKALSYKLPDIREVNLNIKSLPRFKGVPYYKKPASKATSWFFQNLPFFFYGDFFIYLSLAKKLNLKPFKSYTSLEKRVIVFLFFYFSIFILGFIF